jgi:hypothetical protein
MPMGAQWCGLCHADLRPAPAPNPAVVPAPGFTEVTAAVTSAIDTPAAPASTKLRGGRHARPATTEISRPNDDERAWEVGEASLDLDTIDLSVLASPTPDPVARWSRSLSSPGAKIGVMAAGVGLVGLVGLVLLTVAGLVIG